MVTAGQHSRLPRENGTGEHPPVRDDSGDADPFRASRDDVRLALHKVLNSPEFRSVVQLRSFLDYIVSKAIDDRVHDIKGYTIAVEALGRDASFNPVTDPIVRVEAARLRRRLDKYYSGSGKNDPITIAIPKGSYVPSFPLRENRTGSGSAKRTSEAVADRTGALLTEGNPAQVSSISRPASGVMQDLSAEAPSEPSPPNPVVVTAQEDISPVSPSIAVALPGSDPRKIGLPVAVGIMVLAFVAGYAFGTLF